MKMKNDMIAEDYAVAYIAMPDDTQVSGKSAQFRKIAEQMSDLYARKNIVYGDSFGRSVEKYGLIAALTRMSDKFNRAENLILGAENNVSDEALEDTLTDLAAYAIMTVMELKHGTAHTKAHTRKPSAMNDTNTKQKNNETL